MTNEPKTLSTAITVASNYLHNEIENWKGPDALIIGISGPQGSGKSYLTNQLLEHLKRTKPELNCVGLLLDDFYLTHLDQLQISEHARRVGNSLSEGRGLPGTHDLKLAVQTIKSLRNGQFPTDVPVYDKSAFDGAGDRSDKWICVERRVDVVVFEGWMNGFRAIDEDLFTAAYFSTGTDSIVHKTAMHHLLELNSALAEYERLWDMFDRFIYLQTDVEANVYKWRLQQEAGLIAQTGKGMTDNQVISFVDRYMPMYSLYYWRMCKKGAAPKNNNLRIEIDSERKVESVSYM